METLVWSVIMFPLSAFFTAIGIFAWRRKKPMWFWSGSTVDEEDISDIPAYNRANGIMWLAFSALFWASTLLGFFQIETAGTFLAIGCFVAIPLLPLAYGKIHRKYKAR